MKNKISRIFLSLLFVLCSKLAIAQVEFVSETNGTITIRTAGTDKKKDKIISDAERNAFFYLFYRGIPGSTYNHPLIDVNEDAAHQQFKDYFDQFYKYRYQSFVTSVSNSSGILKGKHRKKSEYVDITINATALRKDLEDNNVIRKFGF